MPSPTTPEPPSPLGIFRMLNAFQQTAALVAAVELDLFTTIGALAAGDATAGAIASVTQSAERGITALADYLVVNGLLIKQDGVYSLTPNAATFLDRRSPACIADAAGWFGLLLERGSFNHLAASVRRGGAAHAIPDSEAWVRFARAMAPLMRGSAEYLAREVVAKLDGGGKVLDIAGGHGLFGIAVAQRFPQAEVTLVDAAPVIEVAQENAEKARVSARYHALAGSALPGTEDEVDFGQGYDLVLVTGFLHHFGPAMVMKFLTKARAALASAGRLIALDFVPDPDRVSPPVPAEFSLIMLAETADGRAYTYAEYERFFAEAGFPRLARQEVPGVPLTALVATRG